VVQIKGDPVKGILTSIRHREPHSGVVNGS